MSTNFRKLASCSWRNSKSDFKMSYDENSKSGNLRISCWSVNHFRTVVKIMTDIQQSRFLCLSDCHSDSDFQAQTASHPINLTLGKHQTWISLWLEYNREAYLLPFPRCEPEATCVTTTECHWEWQVNELNSVILIGMDGRWWRSGKTYAFQLEGQGSDPRCNGGRAPTHKI